MILKYDSPFFDRYFKVLEKDEKYTYGEISEYDIPRVLKEYIEKKELIEISIDELPSKKNKIVSKLHFRNLFTISEKVSMLVENLPKTLEKEEDVTLAVYTVKVILEDLQNAETINLEDIRTIRALQYLMSVRIITEDRLNMILSDMKPE